ncbi:MAG: L-amino acid N-acyltransferase YncA [Verrucomicrobiales bacterium]|jgi:L-amino acid N-acyltransferase YncA
MTTRPIIRPCRPAEDTAAIAEIYNYYIRETVITFEVEPISDVEMRNRLEAVASDYPKFVSEAEDGAITGYAYAHAWQARHAYRKTVELSIYLDHEAIGQGIGPALYAKVISEVRERGFHVAIGGLAVPNAPSARLHEKLGFKKVAHYKEVGRKFERWIDVEYWQLML